jgi:hypothetical protein
MTGYPAQRSANIWMQTLGPARVSIAYWPVHQPHLRENSSEISTSAREFYTALLTLDDLAPNTTYQTEIQLDGKTWSGKICKYIPLNSGNGVIPLRISKSSRGLARTSTIRNMIGRAKHMGVGTKYMIP